MTVARQPLVRTALLASALIGVLAACSASDNIRDVNLNEYNSGSGRDRVRGRLTGQDDGIVLFGTARTPRPGEADTGGAGLLDPRAITTREHLVQAFDYLSVRLCGPIAKNWTHVTITRALADRSTLTRETAGILARLYELARYTPPDEPLTASELAEARRLTCHLAGVER